MRLIHPTLRIAALLAILTLMPGLLSSSGQISPTPTTPEAAVAPQATPESDRFPALRERADSLKLQYEKSDGVNMAEVDKLLRGDRCQIARVSGLLDRTRQAFKDWYEAEHIYWKSWSEKEEERVAVSRKSLALMESEQQRTRELVESTRKDRDELLQRKSQLEATAKTADIIRALDDLLVDVRESEARLSQAEKRYTEITASVESGRASLTARLVEIRQSLRRVEAYGLEAASYYEEKRKEAQEVCDTSRPRTGSVPPAKPGRAKPR